MQYKICLDGLEKLLNFEFIQTNQENFAWQIHRICPTMSLAAKIIDQIFEWNFYLKSPPPEFFRISFIFLLKISAEIFQLKHFKIRDVENLKSKKFKAGIR